MTVYRRLLQERDSGDIVVGGASGGNLAAALIVRWAKDEGLPMC